MLSKKLSTNGIMLIEDVTIKNNNEFIPVTLNKRIKRVYKKKIRNLSLCYLRLVREMATNV